jgi:hypothetical protein
MLRAAEHVLKDLHYAARRLRRTPGFVIVSTLLIAVSLACNTVIFGLVDVLLLRTLPVRDPDSLVQLFELRPTIPAQEYLSADIRDLIAAESTTLTDVMGEHEVTTSLEQEAATSSVDVGLVTANYFEGLGIDAALGRNLGIEDTVAGNRITVLSHRAWTRHFQQDPAIVGRTVRLAGQPYLIVGVLSEGFNGTSLDSGPDFRVLFDNREDFAVPGPTTGLTRILARLREGESLYPLAPANPRNTTMARLSRTRSASSRRPIRVPTLVFGTVIILSTMRLLETASPFLSLGVTGSLNNGAGVGLVVNGHIVMESVPMNRSSCRMTTGRGFTA